MTTNRLGTPLSQPTDIPTAPPIGQPSRSESVPRSDQASHGRTDGRTDEELGYVARESSPNASPAGGLEEIHHPGSETSDQPAKPVASLPLSGPVVGVGGRSVAEVRADLALLRRPAADDEPRPNWAWEANAADRLLADVPALLAEVEAAHRFEQQAAVERESLLAENERLRPRCRVPSCPDYGDPDFGEATCPSWHADESPESAAYAAMERRYAQTSTELDHALAERDSLRGVVQAVRELHRRIVLSNGVEVDYCACGKRNCSTFAALAAAADAPQPEPEVRCWAHEPSESCEDCEDDPPGPSPAVLPEKEQR